MEERFIYRPDPEILTRKLAAIVVCGFGGVPDRKEFDRLFGTHAADAFADTTEFVRALAAARLVSAGATETVVTTGSANGNRRPHTEAQSLAYAIGHNLGEEMSPYFRLLIDPHAETTIGNIVHSLHILDKQANHRFAGEIGFVTSRFHIRRLELLIRILGLGSQAHSIAAEDVLRNKSRDQTMIPDESVYRHQIAYMNDSEFRGRMELLLNGDTYIRSQLPDVTNPWRMTQFDQAIRAFYDRHLPRPVVSDKQPI